MPPNSKEEDTPKPRPIEVECKKCTKTFLIPTKDDGTAYENYCHKGIKLTKDGKKINNNHNQYCKKCAPPKPAKPAPAKPAPAKAKAASAKAKPASANTSKKKK